MTDAAKKEYKWQVKMGGTIPADSMDMSHAKTQLGATSQTKALQINKGSDTAPGIDYNTVSVKTASEAPRPGECVDAVDKSQRVRHNASGY